ncbi:hypothetical protein BGK67_35280 (plasmid) [Streptomyces subrutilus]|uniref:Uncharacterized protein n=2 Tax=Streptomyces subrutilus TaxID=36818 RepID=A0A1E5NXC8_9ACTN|nr:hypothetical protein BGK67_35280 [Streptomyces subrutilus]
MATLDGRRVLTRKELAAKHELSISHLETLYRDRENNGHPEAAGTIDRELVWEASAWNRWHKGLTGVKGLESREDLLERTGAGRSTLELLWKERSSNGHPEPEKVVGNTMYWNPKTWDAWYDSYRAGQAWRTDVDFSGNADDLISLSDAARVLHMEPTSITKYPVRPPKHWPAPAEETRTDKGFIKRKYRRGDIWKYAELRERGGGGRPAGTTTSRRFPYDGDPRLAQARAAVAAAPGSSAAQLAGQLAQEHGGTAGTWSHIVRSARQHLED